MIDQDIFKETESDDKKREKEFYLLLKSAELEAEETEKRYNSSEVFAEVKSHLNISKNK